MSDFQSKYEEITIEIIDLCNSDIITASQGAFDGEDDQIGNDW